jgi:uncharacterized membrane protein YgaE (UPF0421/DUF939 family)
MSPTTDPAISVRQPSDDTAPGGVAGLLRRVIDPLASSDPGFDRLLSALSGVINVALAIGAGYAFVKATGALQLPVTQHLPPSAVAKIHLVNHDVLVIAELLGGLIAMAATQGVRDATPRARLESLLMLPLPLIGGLAFGLELAPHRVLLLVAIGLSLTASVYLLRFGARGAAVGFTLFLGAVLGDRLAGKITIGHITWLAAEVGVGLGVAILVKVIIFRGNAEATLRRTQRTFAARARQAIRTALDLLDGPSDRLDTEVHRELFRLNETALIMDAALAGANATGKAIGVLRDSMFDMELALGDLVRFAEESRRLALTPEQRALSRDALANVQSGQLAAATSAARTILSQLPSEADPATDEQRAAIVALARLAGSVLDYADADRRLQTPVPKKEAEQAPKLDPFVPAARLLAGWLPGTTLISAQASLEKAPRSRRVQVRMKPYTRATIQMAIAASLSLAAGDALSGQRFYWAILATWLVFLGTNHVGEQVTKAFNRTAGTAVGVLAGGLCAHLIGYDGTLAIAVILASVFFGFYLMRISYAFMIFAVTIALAQLYQQLHEFSNHLLLVRLEETAIGAGIAAAVVAVVLPLNNRDVLLVALRSYLAALQTLVRSATSQLAGGEPELTASGPGGERQGVTRTADAAYNALQVTARPLARRPFGASAKRAQQIMGSAGSSHYVARTLVGDARKAGSVDEQYRQQLDAAAAAIDGSLSNMQARLGGAREAAYLASGGLLKDLEHQLRRPHCAVNYGQLAVRDLHLIDAAMAHLATVLEMEVSQLGLTAAGLRAGGTPLQTTAGTSTIPALQRSDQANCGESL